MALAQEEVEEVEKDEDDEDEDDEEEEDRKTKELGRLQYWSSDHREGTISRISTMSTLDGGFLLEQFNLCLHCTQAEVCHMGSFCVFC